jgi:hypothetical protein
MTSKTRFENKAAILSEIWTGYRDDVQFFEFIESNDVGFPLAYAVTHKLVSIEDKGKVFIEETFSSLLELLEIEDQAFEYLDDLLTLAEDSKD